MAKDKTFELVNKMYTEFSERFEKLEDDVTGIKNDFTGIKNDVTGIKNDVITLRGETKVISIKVDGLNEKLKMHDKDNNQGFKRLDKKYRINFRGCC
jgi:archaellum component FlaC